MEIENQRDQLEAQALGFGGGRQNDRSVSWPAGSCNETGAGNRPGGGCNNNGNRPGPGYGSGNRPGGGCSSPGNRPGPGCGSGNRPGPGPQCCLTGPTGPTAPHIKGKLSQG